MPRLLQKMANREEFEAPDWVKNDSVTPPVTNKQKRILNISLFVVVPFCLWAGWFEFGRAEGPKAAIGAHGYIHLSGHFLPPYLFTYGAA